MLNLKAIIVSLFFSISFIHVNAQEAEFKIEAITKTSDTYPCVSKDGKFVFFASNRDGDNDIYVYSVEEKSTKQITNLAGDESQPDISPDGSKLTFYATVGDVEQGLREIHMSDIDGSNIKRLTDHGVTTFHPKFTPDGTKVPYNKQVSPEIDRFEFYTVDIATGEKELILTDTKSITFGSFSPDGSKLVFVKWMEGMDAEVFLADADGSNQINVSKNSLFNGWPTWTPDSKNIIFASDKDKKFHFHLYRYNLASKTTLKITEGDRQFIQPTASMDKVFANSNYTRDSSSQIVSFPNK